MKKLLILALLLIPTFVQAGSVTLSWTLPTQNTDGTAYTDPGGLRLYYGTTPGGPYPIQVSIGDPTVTTYQYDNLAPGTYYFVATAYNSSNVESAFSGEATKVIDPSVPAPPTNLVVVPGELVAYGLQQSPDVLTVFPVGHVVEGTACDGSMTIMGLYQVPRESVVYAGNVEPQVVFAKCV